jgi:hypothetical protein
LESGSKIARILVTIPAAFLAVVPPLVDLGESHVLNPLWTGHARLHTVWLLATNALVALIAIGVLWRPSGRPLRASVRLAGALVGAILAGFFAAAATQSVYGGSLTDPNGVAMTAGPIDANLAVFSVHLCLVGVALWLVRNPSDSSP